MTAAIEKQLADGIAALALDLNAAAQSQLLVYLQLLAKWNQAYNLTAIRRLGEMVTKHLLDSLAVIPYLQGGRILDAGTGAGLPGIPLAIAYPEREFVLLDSNGKKAAFLRQACQTLNLKNVKTVNERVETYSEPPGFDSIVSRAFASIADMLQLTQHLLAPGGQFLAMKGVYPAAELQALPAPYKLLASRTLLIPGLDAERHLICIGN